MARDKQRLKEPTFRRRKQQPDPYSSKIIKRRSEHEQDDLLRHAVRTQDSDAFEEWDEPEY